MDVSVYFNPACSNCRTAEGLLRERGIDADYVRYLEQAPSRAQLEEVLAGADRETLLEALVAHPVLIQRPIVVVGDRAVVARPAERLLELLDPPAG
jgi:arsenate reductase (glutaredoxin)